MVKTARAQKSDVEPEDGTELLPPHGQTRMKEELFLTREQGKCFLEMESAPDEDAVKIIEMTTKD